LSSACTSAALVFFGSGFIVEPSAGATSRSFFVTCSAIHDGMVATMSAR
jgi:hypothetical protein